MQDVTTIKAIIDKQIRHFPANGMCRKVDAGLLDLRDYHRILRMIFYQTYEGPQTFALAAINCPSRLQDAKDYLLRHADEEKSHWRWVLKDLETTGWKGEKVELSIPRPACQNYVSFNYFIALKMPIARLAIAAVLEGIGAAYGGYYAREICRILGLQTQQAQFYLGHGDTDVGHIEEIWRVIESSDLTSEEVLWMGHSAEMAGQLYKSMYEEAATS